MRRRASTALLVVTSVGLVAFGGWMIRLRPIVGPRGYGDILCPTCDTESYLAMVEGQWLLESLRDELTRGVKEKWAVIRSAGRASPARGRMRRRASPR